MYKYLFPACMLLLLLTGNACKSPAAMAGWKGTTNQLKISDDAAGRIAFLTFVLTATDTIRPQYQCRLSQRYFAAGTLKTTLFRETLPIEPNYLYFRLYDSRGRLLQEFREPDPLSTSYEFPGDEHGAAMQRAVIRKKSGELTVRLQVSPVTRYLAIARQPEDFPTLKTIYYAEL